MNLTEINSVRDPAFLHLAQACSLLPSERKTFLKASVFSPSLRIPPTHFSFSGDPIRRFFSDFFYVLARSRRIAALSFRAVGIATHRNGSWVIFKFYLVFSYIFAFGRRRKRREIMKSFRDRDDQVKVFSAHVLFELLFINEH